MRISKLLSALLGLSSIFRFGIVEGEPGYVAPVTPTPARQEPATFPREYVTELREESKAVRLSNAELKAQLKEATDKLNAAETTGKESLTKAEQTANERVLRAELKAAAVKAGVVDLDLLKVLDLSALKLDADGNVEGADAFFEAAKKAKPHFFGTVSVGTTTKTPEPKPGTPPSVREMSREEYAKAKKEASRRS